MAGNYLIFYTYFDEEKYEKGEYPVCYCPVDNYKTLKEAKQIITNYISNNQNVLFLNFFIYKWSVMYIDGEKYEGYFDKKYIKTIRKIEDFIGKGK